MDSAIAVRAAAKINLYLAVGPVRADGFHPLATVFQSVGLYDDIFAAPAPKLTLTMAGHGRHLSTDNHNLAIRAAHVLAREAGLAHYGARLHIHKRIPIAGGMAGGSADAAATLVALNQLWDLGWTTADLARLGAQLGSDVPFCVTGGTAIGRGRGEHLETIACPQPRTFLIVTMKRGLSTAKVFAEFDRLQQPSADLQIDKDFLAALQRGDWPAIAAGGRNDLMTAALNLHRGARRTMEFFAARNIPVLLSGSGPTLIAFVNDADRRADIATEVAQLADVARTYIATGPVAGVQNLDDTAPGGS